MRWFAIRKYRVFRTQTTKKGADHMEKTRPVYKETRVFTFPNMIVRVHIPDIDDEENERRMKDLKKAAEDFLRAL